MSRVLVWFLSARSERGATTAEYGLIIAAVVIFAAGVWLFQEALGAVFGTEVEKVENDW